MRKWLIFLGIILIVSWIVAIHQTKIFQKKYEDAMSNVKAYDALLSSSNEESRVLKLSVEQLNYFNDSILKKLNDTRKELKVKDKKIQALQYLKSSFKRKDTIRLKDTIFREPSFKLDTLLGDEWFKVQVGLKYPSTIAITPEFKSEKHVIVSTKRETINPPKKFFLFRWFQKKHTVTKVDVIEKNPYVQDEKQQFIEISR